MAKDAGIIDLPAPKSPARPSQVFFDRKGKGVRIRQPYMNDSHGGGQLEDVPGFDKSRARIAGLPHTVSVPTPLPLGAPATAEESGFESAFHIGDPLTRIGDTTALPFRSIAYLDLTFTDGSRKFGTGWFVAANTIATAAHCFYDPSRRVPVSEVVVVPGYSPGQQPFLSHRLARVFVPPAWRASVDAGHPDPTHDYALGYLEQPDVGKTVSWFGLAAVPDDGLDNLLLNIAGYSRFGGPVAMYYDGGRLKNFDGKFLYHRFDTEEGMSGSPIIVRRDDRRYVIGIHSWGGAENNRARRIDDGLFDELSGRLA